MPRPSRRRAASGAEAASSTASKWKRIAAWSVPVVLVLGVVAFVAVRMAIDAYLRSERFRDFLAKKAGTTLRADARVAPLHFDSASIYADGFTAQGSSESAFSSLQVDGVRAELSWRRFFEKVWQVEHVDVQRVAVRIDGPRIDVPGGAKGEVVTTTTTTGAANGEGEPGSSTQAPRAAGWLPNRVEIARATVRQTELSWQNGGLKGTALEFHPTDGGWDVEGSGGTITNEGLPPLDVQQLTLRYHAPVLFVQQAEFHQGSGGSVSATGEIDFERKLELHATLKNISLTPFLAGDWRVRLHGDASGEITVKGPLPQTPGSMPEITGHLSIANGQIEALPVLDEIATFTRLQQFKRVVLSRASGDFTQAGQRLTVRNFLAESAGLIRIEGEFAIQNGMIAGVFQVGVTPGSLQWLPGSQSRVFTVSRDGYLWAPMQLSGPLAAPKEDLSARLAAAAAGEVVDTAQGFVNDAAKNAKDVVKGALDLLLK